MASANRGDCVSFRASDQIPDRMNRSLAAAIRDPATASSSAAPPRSSRNPGALAEVVGDPNRPRKHVRRARIGESGADVPPGSRAAARQGKATLPPPTGNKAVAMTATGLHGIDPTEIPTERNWNSTGIPGWRTASRTAF